MFKVSVYEGEGELIHEAEFRSWAAAASWIGESGFGPLFYYTIRYSV